MERKTVERLRPEINRVRALADRLNAEQREMRARFDVLRSDLRNVERRNSTSRIDDAERRRCDASTREPSAGTRLQPTSDLPKSPRSESARNCHSQTRNYNDQTQLKCSIATIRRHTEYVLYEVQVHERSQALSQTSCGLMARIFYRLKRGAPAFSGQGEMGKNGRLWRRGRRSQGRGRLRLRRGHQPAGHPARGRLDRGRPGISADHAARSPPRDGRDRAGSPEQVWKINSDLHIQHLFDKIFSRRGIAFSELPYYSPQALRQAFDGLVADPGQFEWRGLEVFWGRKP